MWNKRLKVTKMIKITSWLWHTKYPFSNLSNMSLGSQTAQSAAKALPNMAPQRWDGILGSCWPRKNISNCCPKTPYDLETSLNTQVSKCCTHTRFMWVVSSTTIMISWTLPRKIAKLAHMTLTTVKFGTWIKQETESMTCQSEFKKSHLFGNWNDKKIILCQNLPTKRAKPKPQTGGQNHDRNSSKT